MAGISAEAVRTLREKTGLGMMKCKEALVEAGGDPAKAEEVLRKQGHKTAELKAGRSTKEGLIGFYLHHDGRMGSMVEILCETDFVARNEAVKAFAKNVSMHVAASSPKYLRREDVPAEAIEKEKEIARAQVQGKPAGVAEKIVAGKLEKFYQEVCLMDQPYVRDETGKETVADQVKALVAKTGENVKISRFVRFRVGE